MATGAFNTPRVPAFARELDQSIVQLHSKQYRNPSQIQKGEVLVVGAGNSGAEIAIRGIVESSPGLYFVGLLFLYSLSSALLGGVGRDAKYIVEHRVSTRPARVAERRDLSASG